MISLLICSLLCWCAALWRFAVNVRRCLHWTYCDAVVHDVASRAASDEQVTGVDGIWPLYAEFQDAQGQTRQLNIRYYSRTRAYKVGDRIGVIHDPQDPAIALIADPVVLHLGSLILFMLSFISGALAYSLATAHR